MLSRALMRFALFRVSLAENGKSPHRMKTTSRSPVPVDAQRQLRTLTFEANALFRLSGSLHRVHF